MTLPNASSALPLIAAITLTTNSGADVPNATTVKPITKSEIPKRFATADAPSVKALAPIRINANPNINNITSIIFRCFLILFEIAILSLH